MSNLRNSVQLIGHLGANPEVKKFDNDGMMATVNIATRERRKNANGEYENYSSWHRLVGWNKTAERMEKVLEKGREIAVHGKLVNRSYDDKNGIKRYVTEILVSDFTLLGKNPNKGTAELDVAPEKEAVKPF